MSALITLAGVDRTSRTLIATDIAYTLGSRGVARLKVKDTQADTATALRPTIDQTAVVNDGATVLFNGAILEVRDSAIVDPRRGVMTDVSATDHSSLCDGRVVTGKTYAVGQTRKQIVTDLHTSYLTGAFSSITLDAGMTNGGTLTAELTFENVKLTAAFQKISEIFQDVIRITPAGVLQAFAPGDSVAPFSLTSSNATIIGGPKWTKTRREYVNSAILICGPESGAFLSSETRTGDGTTNAWMVDYLGYTSPWTIVVGGVFKNVGPGLEYTWDLTTTPYPTLRVGTDPIPGVGVLIEYGYYVNYPFRHVVSDASAATNPREEVYRLPDVTTRAAADVEGAAIIRKSLASAVSRVVTVRTRAGLALPGDVVTITVPERTLSGSWLITGVQIRSDIDKKFTYDLTCVEGIEAKGSWQDWWRDRNGTGAMGGTTTITGGGVAGVTGTGTPGTLPIFGASTVLTDSLIRQGTGTPEGVVTAPIASMFLRTDTGDVYRKATGSGNTGWTLFGGAGSGTIDTLSKWVTTSTLGDSLLSEGSGIVSVNGHLHPSLTDTYDLGRYDKLWNQGYLAQINAVLFALTTQTLFGGYSTVGTNAGSFAAAVGSADTTIVFDQAMTVGHFVLVRAHDTGGNATAEYIQVGSLVSGTTYNVTRNLSGLGAKNWAKGVPFLVLGTTGVGRIDLLAYDNKPRIQFVEQGATYNAQTTRAVLGNLNGYYGYATDIYGAAFGEATGAWLKIDPTNGIRIGHNTTDKITLSAAGNAAFTGNITAAGGTIGGWTISATALSAGSPARIALDTNIGGNVAAIICSDTVSNWAAMFSGSSGSDIGLMVGGTTPGTAPFRVTLGGALTCTGANVTGTVSATAGAIGGWTIGSTTLTGGNATLASSGNLTLGTVNDVFRASADDATYRLWIGNATAGSAPFRVSKAGEAWITNAHVSGEIDANSGTLGSLTVDGTITVGSGGSISAGGGNVTLGPGGLTLTAGTGASNQIIWSNGATIHGWGGTSTLTLNASVTEVNQTFKVYGATIEFGTIGADTGTALVLNASSLVKTDSSSERYKQNVQPLATNPSAILGAKPIRFDFRDGTRDVVGFSAEQVASVAPELVNLDAKGRPDSLRLQGMLAYVVALLQANDKRLKALEAR